jgi:DNA (cytosine-5)-methyltransferase 1
MKIEAIDLFCGVGGLTRGLLDAGIVVKAGYDLDGACKHAYEKNNRGAKFFEIDVASLRAADLQRKWSADAVRLLVGCAPCQPFSTAANAARTATSRAKEGGARAVLRTRHGSAPPPDHRYDLLDHFGRLVWSIRPEFVTMENVPRVKNHVPFKRFVERLKKRGYHVWFKSVQCTTLGVPQTRRRLVLLASRLGPFERNPLAHSRGQAETVEEAIGALRPLNAGEFDPMDPIHVARGLSEVNLARIKASTPGGTWEQWPEHLRSACHKKDSGKSYKSVYARMRSDRPAPTITTQFYNFGTGRFGHPSQHRSLTPREAAILQSFPRNYVFIKKGQKVHMNALGRMIGNAVPPKLGAAIGKTVVRHVAAHKKRQGQPGNKPKASVTHR